MATKQHFVSQFHLRGFIDPESATSPDPWFWVGDIDNNTIKRRAPKNLGWSRGMFDGPGALADRHATLEALLANEIEPGAARALQMFSKQPAGQRREVPAPITRYLAWAAARNLPMVSLYRNWVDAFELGHLSESNAAERKWMQDACPLHSMEHIEFGIRNDVPCDEVFAMAQDGWKLRLSHDDVLEIIHLQAHYFQSRFFRLLQWVILDAPDGKSFVITDRPVVWGVSGKVSCRPNMLDHPSVQLFAPLTRSITLFAFHPRGCCPEVVQVDQVNQVMAWAAVNWVAGPDEKTVQKALECGRIGRMGLSG